MKFRLVHRQSRERAIEEVRRAPDGYIVTIEQPKRSLDQNARFHAMLSDISKSVVWQGNEFNPTVWKRLLTAAYLREIGESPMLVPAIDGAGIDIVYEKTSTMNVKTMSELIEFTMAWGTSNGAVWSARAMKGEL